jgi:hypothetical protein
MQEWLQAEVNKGRGDRPTNPCLGLALSVVVVVVVLSLSLFLVFRSGNFGLLTGLELKEHCERSPKRGRQGS